MSSTPHDSSCQCVDCRSRRRAQQVVADAVGSGQSNQAEQQYTSARGPSNLAIFCLLLLGIVLIASIISTIVEISLLQQVADGEAISEAQADSNDSRQALIGWVYIGVFVVSAIMFLVWISHASNNLVPLGAEGQQHSPGWAVGSWFVPVVWLYRPYQVMKEIWKGSHSEIAGEQGPWSDAPVSRLLGFWWATWLVSSWGDWIATRILFSGDLTVERLIVSDWFSVVSAAILLVALVLVVILIRGITTHQEKKFSSYGY